MSLVTSTGVSHQGFRKLHRFAYCNLKGFFWGGGKGWCFPVVSFIVIATYGRGERCAQGSGGET